MNYHFSTAEELPVPVDLLVTGSVPAGSGLSSSAAMVVSSTLAFLAVNGKVIHDHFVSFFSRLPIFHSLKATIVDVTQVPFLTKVVWCNCQ